jgi:uncharacterized protein (DUF1810 family)
MPRKRTHWMWFVFRQLRGLGHSSMARSYGIGSLHEAPLISLGFAMPHYAGLVEITRDRSELHSLILL